MGRVIYGMLCLICVLSLVGALTAKTEPILLAAGLTFVSTLCLATLIRMFGLDRS